ncbi:MAG TPA: SIMPL domain-containing protein, partial [Candidatus Paceibacterota bacterium]|nr:SIMPL domain-containing protein [Candidatus Paceibacterota bacterium]
CPGKQVLVGYEVSQTLSVKVRDTKMAGDLLSGVGSRGATEVSGLSFTIDDEDALKAEARDKAIAQAKSKAEVLAKSLGVSLVRVVGFYENEGGMPIYAYGLGGDERMMTSSAPKASPEIPVGQNKIVSNVSVTYEIR